MRPIKFRAWDIDNQEWCNEDILLGSDGFINTMNGEHGEEIIIQFFTGLLDKNGKEIYEGDILQEHFFISRFVEESPFEIIDGKRVMKETKVQYRSKYEPILKGKWKTEPQNDIFEVKSLRQIYEYLKDWEEVFEEKDLEKWNKGNLLEVIGNIYENPELLGGDNVPPKG